MVKNAKLTAFILVANAVNEPDNALVIPTPSLITLNKANEALIFFNPDVTKLAFFIINIIAVPMPANAIPDFGADVVIVSKDFIKLVNPCKALFIVELDTSEVCKSSTACWKDFNFASGLSAKISIFF